VKAKTPTAEWLLLTSNPEAVLSALERGETDGILPAACGLMDRFAQFMIRMGIPAILEAFPDPRKRKSIPAFLFCNLLLHKSVFRLKSLKQIGAFLFSCPDVIRALGFNMRQIQEGFYSGSEERPMNVEALGDFFAECALSDFTANQKQMMLELVDKEPSLLDDGSLIMDCIEARIPAGHRGREEKRLKTCVISARSEGEALPLLWTFASRRYGGDITEGKALVEEALPLLGSRVKRLIVDRGFICGEWMTDLKHRDIDTVIGLRSCMILYQDMLSLSREKDAVWLEAEPPKYHDKKKRPIHRHITYVDSLETWDACGVTLTGIVIRDTYADKIEYQAVVTTDLSASAEQIHDWIRSRWAIEETFMEESRYGSLNSLGSCRESLGAAIVHFTLLTYTLLRLFVRQEELDKAIWRPKLPTGGIEFVAYWGEYYAIILPSQLVEIVARCAPRWGDKLPGILAKLKALERAS
jgi:hypothetical protein